MKKIKYAAYLLFLVTASFLAVYFCKDISFSDFFSRIFTSSQKEEQEVYIFESLADDAANSPVTNEVQTVRKVRLKQAVAIGEGNAGAFYNNPDYQDVIPVDIDSFSEADIPSKYDSRDVGGKNNVTRVENQGNSYLCWCFSSLSAIECDILKHHDDIDNTELDLSEKHLSYYNLHRTEGSYQGLIDDDYRILINADNNKNDWVFDYDTGYITCGGVPDYCISLLTAWKGPVNEAGNDAFFAVTGSTDLFTKNAEKPSDPYGSEYHVQGVYQIPASLNNMTMIKQMVMEHAGVTVGMDAKDKNFKDHNSYNYSTQGDSPLKTANHEVVIIGWDDDFSASKFRTKPPGDGAWLCKNSWGENMGDEGFFYISYYDETLPIGNATAYHVAMPKDYDWYDNNYQAAGFLTPNCRSKGIRSNSSS